MSSIDMKSTEEEYYPKDSFDRYGDDLCEEILSYLSLEDCFRFECLSKQWKRLIFKPQVCLNVDEVVHKLIRRKDGKSRSQWFGNINFQALESMVKKLPNIKSIHMTISSQKTERVFRKLMKSYEHSFIAIHVRIVSTISLKALNTLLLKYGSQLTAISVPQCFYRAIISYANYLPKLRQLYGYSSDPIKSLLSEIVTENNEILLKNLTHFRYPFKTSDENRLTRFVDHYKNSLKSFSIVFDGNEVTAEEYIHVLSLTSQMKALRELSIGLIWDHYINPHKIKAIVEYHCEEFVNEWSHVMRYRLNIFCKTSPHVIRVYEAMNMMKQFGGLELMFETSLNLIGDKVYLTDEWTYLSFCLKNVVLNETFLDSIHTHLPHIHSLEITLLKMTPTIETIGEKLWEVENEPLPFGHRKCGVHMGTPLNTTRHGSWSRLTRAVLRHSLRQKWQVNMLKRTMALKTYGGGAGGGQTY